LLKIIDYGQANKVRKNGNNKTVLFVALELAQKETLLDFVTQIDGQPFSESIAVQFFEQFIFGL
jgi:serine/threonine protein kinase